MNAFEYPIYKKFDEGAKMNPYYEFASFCAMTYEEMFSHISYAYKELRETPNGIVKIIRENFKLGDDDIEIITSGSYDAPYSLNFFEGDKMVGTFKFNYMKNISSPFERNLNTIGYGSYLNKIKSIDLVASYSLIFYDNPCLNYIFSEHNMVVHPKDNEYTFVDFDDCTIKMLLCILYGLYHFDDFMKFHKMAIIKSNTILKYIEDYQKTHSLYKLHYTTDYNGVMLTIENIVENKISSTFIDFNNRFYVDDMEDFFEKL